MYGTSTVVELHVGDVYYNNNSQGIKGLLARAIT